MNATGADEGVSHMLDPGWTQAALSLQGSEFATILALWEVTRLWRRNTAGPTRCGTGDRSAAAAGPAVQAGYNPEGLQEGGAFWETHALPLPRVYGTAAGDAGVTGC